MNGKLHPGHLPRLQPEFYQGDAAVHWTLTVFDRGVGWLNDSFHSQFRELLLHVAAREGLLCPTYCLDARPHSSALVSVHARPHPGPLPRGEGEHITSPDNFSGLVVAADPVSLAVRRRIIQTVA